MIGEVPKYTGYGVWKMCNQVLAKVFEHKT